MLEGLVAWVINTYVGEFFEDLNADQLSVGLLQGEVELENLPLKKDAFNFFSYPLEIRSGSIGRIKLQIPVYRLHSEPWVIFIEKLYVVVGPVSTISYDEEKESKAAYKRKLACLQNQNAQWKAHHGRKQESNYYSFYTNWRSYSTSVLANIMENIQLNLRDVHIRYEDDTTCLNKQFACGLIIRGLAAQSTDENWVPLFVKTETNEMTWKLAQLEGLSLYWDTNAQMIGNLGLQQMMEGMTESMESCISSDGTVREKEYIVSSVDATARLKRNCCSEALKSPLNARIVCDIQMEKILLNFSQNQYHQILQWERSFNCLYVKWNNRKWRPSNPVSSYPREWWFYAISSYLEPRRQKKCSNTWEVVLEHARNITEYCSIYREYLRNTEILPLESKARKDELEMKLELDVLLILRELVMEEILRKKAVVSGDESQSVKGGGFFQWLFPSWVGWNSTLSSEVDEKKNLQDHLAEGTEAKLEEEILTVLNTAANDTFLKRDALFIQLNFCLLRGSVVLLQNNEGKILSALKETLGKPVIELEFSDVFMKLETKPRTRSVLFDIKLGALYLYDRMFKTSHFPYVIAAQNQENVYFTSSKPTCGMFPFYPQKAEVSQGSDVNRWLFELLYEKNPQDVQSDYRLVIKTKPLDVICNLDLIRIVVSIFSPASSDDDQNIVSLPSAASVHYEHFKEHTKAELQQTWDRMLIGEKKSKKNWCIKLEISAPQVLIPENIYDPNANVVIFVLGDLHVFNALKEKASKISSGSNTFDDEDDFYTPCSTPEEYTEQHLDVSKATESCKSGDILLNRMYESYTLELQNMQVLVSSLKDSWKFAQLRGSSSLHILDQFSINIQVYRRTFLTEDSQWPSLVFIASLPKLTAHISELKVGAIKACIEDLESYFGDTDEYAKNESHHLEVQKLGKNFETDHLKTCESISDISRSSVEKSFFLLMQLSVDQMSFDIQSQSQSVAELQVSGVKTRFSMHHSETLLSLTVHSLLVVDALQTYGPDFELLVASHKHVSMDNSSGKLMNTDSTDILGAFSSPTHSQSTISLDDGSSLPWAEEKPDDEALIFFEFRLTYLCDNKELRSANVRFNNLDIIANQETIIELVGLLKRIGEGGRKSQSKALEVLRSRSKSQVESFLKKDTKKIEISFVFHHLNVLLLRAMCQSGVGQKLATATLRDVYVKAEISSSTEIFGNLGGVQVLDLVTEGTKYQKVISLSNETVLLDNSDSFRKSGGDECLKRTAHDYREALSFHVIKRDIRNSSQANSQADFTPMKTEVNMCELDIFLRMASLCYVHSPYLLFELSCCASEFKSYLKSLASSIKSAATEMAKGIVTLHSTQLDHGSNCDIYTCEVDVPVDEDMKLILSCDIFMKSPVIVLPHNSSSPEVFTAHLGHIALHNKSFSGSTDTCADFTSQTTYTKDDVLHIDVSEMSLFYVNIDSDVSYISNKEVANAVDGNLSIDEHSRCPILHDTAIEIFIYPFQDVFSYVFGLKTKHFQSMSDNNLKCKKTNEMEQVKVNAQVVSPLNVDITKQQYEQMLKLLTNLSCSYTKSSDISSFFDPPKEGVISSSCYTDVSLQPEVLLKMSKCASVAKDIVQRQILVCVALVLPSLKIELREYENEKDSLVSLIFQEFVLNYEEKSLSECSLQATLSSLLMEDLQDNSDDTHRSILISSSNKEKMQNLKHEHQHQYLSSSCPDIYRHFPETMCSVSSPSLPDNLCTESLFSQKNDYKTGIGMKSFKKHQRSSSYPNTPPPSPMAKQQTLTSSVPSKNALVSLRVLIIDIPTDGLSAVHRKSLSVDIDFNCLDIVFSLHPWNIVFNFFSTGTLGEDVNYDKTVIPHNNSVDEVLFSNSKTVMYDTSLKICAKSLTVVLSKPEYDLMSANVSNFSSLMSEKDNNFHLEGSLGSISILDLTPMGQLYRERLVTLGTEAFQFSVFSIGNSTTSSGSDSVKEIHIKGQLSSIMYVHTQRLITEITAFFQYFHDKKHFIKETNSSSSVGHEICSKTHSSHILINMSLHSPIIIIPSSALSKDLLLIELQTITITSYIIDENSKKWNYHSKPSMDRSAKNFAQKGASSCVSDMTSESKVKSQNACANVISIDFSDVALYSGVHHGIVEGQNVEKCFKKRVMLFPSYMVLAKEYLLHEAFTFHLQVEKNICIPFPQKVPEVKITGTLSSVHVTLDMEQYKLIRSILRHNFGEALEEGIYDPCKEIGQFVLLDVTEVSTTMSWSIELLNVTLDLCLLSNEKEKEMLAKFDFIKSHLSYVVFSNNRTDVDFFSNEIRIYDIRYKDYPANKRPNVFTNVLLPNKDGASSTLQAELHYRMKNDSTKVSILLNNMKVVGIMDFIKNTLDFLSCPLSSHNIQEENIKTHQKVEHCMEMKLNVTNTEFVVVEDSSVLDSSAVIAKTTAVIVWKPNDIEKPLSFNLEPFEMFSCVLGLEEETALSIIDPVNMCIDLVNKQTSPIAKLQIQDELCALEVSASSLYMRFSYYDLMMFIKILDSLKRQIGGTSSQYSVSALEPGKDVLALVELGFNTADCQNALKICNGNLTDAALWLTQNSTPSTDIACEALYQKQGLSSDVKDGLDLKNIHLFSIEIRVDSIGLCIIDDCRDADVPILEFHLADVNVTQKLRGNQEGYGMFAFSLDYYNCALSGWEPLVEPWRCQTKWNTSESFEDSSKKLFLNINTEDVVNINLTNAFLNMFKMVKDNWTEDYFDRSLSSSINSNFNRTRAQLVPFALKNKTGCKLWFATQVRTSKRFESYQGSTVSSLVWKPVENWETSLFTFGRRVKLRHEDSHQETLHQIIIRVEGWQTAVPVSVDRVGTYFRNITRAGYYFAANNRIIFKVKLESNSQKCITVESALSITNKLEDVLEVKLECPGALHGVKEEHLFISPDETFPIPLLHVHSQMWIRPIDKSLAFSDSPIEWYHVTKPGEVVGCTKVCNSTRLSSKPYRLCVCIKHGNYCENSDLSQCRETVNTASTQFQISAGHRIIVKPCLEVHNMLPCELNFFISDARCTRSLKPGKKQSICNIDIAKPFTFGVSIENFKQSNTINIYSTSRHYPSHLELRDVHNRVLFLQLHATLTASAAAIQLVVSAPYWFVNKTGLPLVFKQEGTQTEASGQFEEHEMARSMTPLLFSFYDEDAAAMCSMRIGKHLHPDGLPLWCSRFRLEKGVQVRRLHVARNDSRPDWVYNIGIEVISGKGKYKGSGIVTLSPRYQLDNRSKHTLEFCQKFAINENRKFVLSAMPGCNFPFHWPRIDLDNLLCVRIASIPQCYWSGGFSIGSIKSFFINMRDSDGASHFLQTEIVLHEATYYIIFTDAESLPPPIRIDNDSEVAVTYYQTNVSKERLKTTVRPHTSVPYALDEPMLPPYITCSAPGGSVATYNMNIFREGSQLFYENFIYIAFTASLTSEKIMLKKSDVSPQFFVNCIDQELVLDVPSGTRVILSKKEAGKRSQLWRMTSNEMLQHEGSSPPCDYSKSHSSSQNVQKLVLDIAGLGPQPQEFIPLMLRKPDARRHNTQTWKFTSDGRLCCGYPNMYVQVQNGYLGLKTGNYAVLGPVSRFPTVSTETGIPVEQAVCRQKLRGGCGVLSVRVVPDGPTRVLKICDLKQKANSSKPCTSVNGEACNSNAVLSASSAAYSNVESEKQSSRVFEIKSYVKLTKGLGVSVVNHLNEDLVYIMMHDIMLELCKSSSSLMLDGSFKSIQVDNQLHETEWPVSLFVTPSSKSDSQRHLPAVHFTLHYIETSLVNARIFKHLIVTFKNLTVQLEEFLVLKLLQFCGFNQTSDELEELNETNNELQSSLFRHVTNDPRYYFSTLKIALQQMRLSVHTTDRLPMDLQLLKSKLGLRLISFEDAPINLDPFLKVHPFETSHFLIESIVDHYKQELKSQAAKILGAVDFLGNPLGLMNDVTDGISELIHEHSVGGLIKNVAHGLSDSAAKLSESLSDGLGSVVIDEKHQMMRKQIRHGSSSRGNDHLMAGIRGLGIGLLGGVTSIFTETYEGAANEGLQGLLSGFGKGLVGTVAKPAVGFLDLASGAASAVRDTSKRSSRLVQPHRRPPRMTVGSGGLLPTYSLQQALDQELLYSLNNKNYSELFVAKETIRSREEDLQVLVSSEKLYFLSAISSSHCKVMLIVSLGELMNCCYVSSQSGILSESRYYIQLHTKSGGSSGVKVSSCQSIRNYPLLESDEWSCKKPQVRCDSAEVAEKAVVQINYAKSLYEERRFILEDDELDLPP